MPLYANKERRQADVVSPSLAQMSNMALKIGFLLRTGLVNSRRPSQLPSRPLASPTGDQQLLTVIHALHLEKSRQNFSALALPLRNERPASTICADGPNQTRFSPTAVDTKRRFLPVSLPVSNQILDFMRFAFPPSLRIRTFFALPLGERFCLWN
jgi:hypothetical protein